MNRFKLKHSQTVGLTYGLLAALFLLVVLGLSYWMMPTLRPDFKGIYIILFVAVLPLLAFSRGIVPMVVWVAVALAFWLIHLCVTSPMFYASQYEKLLGATPEVDFKTALPPINIDQAPLVSEDMARQAMQKRLSELSSIGSQVRVGDVVKQLVKGELVWVAYLEHSGFFKWFSDGSTPGYLVVSAHDPADVRLVMEHKGVPLKMKYLSSAFFEQNVERKAYTSGLMHVGLTNFEPEIDEEGHPFYVATTYRNSIGFSGREATGMVLVDVLTGEVKLFKLGTEPSWVDRVIPADFVEEQMEYRGEFINGYINLNDEGRMKVSGSIDLVYGSDNRAYWIGGMTSKGKNTGLSGFYYVDSKTKAVRWLKVPSVSQQTAAHAAENVNPEKRYSATNPLPFLVNGIPTYVMALRDSQGVSRAYGMVDMRNNQVIGVAETLSSTLRGYTAKQSADRTNVEVGAKSTTKVILGTVSRIAQEYRNNATTYFLKMDAVTGKPGETHSQPFSRLIFTGTSDLSEDLVMTKEGDVVELSYSDSGTRVVGVSKFANKTIGSDKAVTP